MTESEAETGDRDGANLINYAVAAAAWLEQQPSSELQSKPELTEEGSDGSSSCGSIESPPVRSRLTQISRSEDLDGTTSARHV